MAEFCNLCDGLMLYSEAISRNEIVNPDKTHLDNFLHSLKGEISIDELFDVLKNEIDRCVADPTLRVCTSAICCETCGLTSVSLRKEDEIIYLILNRYDLSSIKIGIVDPISKTFIYIINDYLDIVMKQSN